MTLLHSFLRANRLKQWLARPDCPPAIKECKILFDRLSSSNVATTPVASEQPLSPSHVQYDGLTYAQSRSHLGNSLILFSPDGDTAAPLVPGQIIHIFICRDSTTFWVRRYLPLEKGITDPFQPYVHVPIKLCSSKLNPTLEKVEVNWVVGHFALYPLSIEQIAVVSLSRVSCIFISNHLRSDNFPGLNIIH